MTYVVAFDITERFLDAAIGVISLVGAIAMLALAIRQASREYLRATSWFWAGAGGLLWAAFEIHNTGLPLGLLLGGVGAAVAVALAFLAWRDVVLTLRDSSPRARSVAAVAAAVLLLLISLQGVQQLSAFDLAHRLAAGDATVVTGEVQEVREDNGNSECFMVGGHEYCYTDGPTSVGFHQAATNGGPIHNGLLVRVTSIGDVIVRLEIAAG